MANKEILYSQSGRTGTFFTDDEGNDLLFERKIALYLKVGLFFHWTWQDFEATPYPVIKRLSEEIDFRIENLGGSMLLNWDSLSTLDGIARAFGGSKQE